MAKRLQECFAAISPSVTMSIPAPLMSLIATIVLASSLRFLQMLGGRHLSHACRVRGTDFDSIARSTSHSGCG